MIARDEQPIRPHQLAPPVGGRIILFAARSRRYGLCRLPYPVAQRLLCTDLCTDF